MSKKKKKPARLDRNFYVVRKIEAEHCRFEEKLYAPGFLARFELERKALGLSRADCAKPAGISDARLSQIINHEDQIGWDLFAALSYSINHRPFEFIREWHDRPSGDGEGDG